MKEIYVTYYSKEKGKLELSYQEWYNFRIGSITLHNLDGPAVIFVGEYLGTKKWYVEGKCHREDGPAVEQSDGTKAWYTNGKRHRLDGPAIEMPRNNIVDYYIDDMNFWSNEDFNKLIKEIDSLDPALGLIDPRWWVRDYWKKKLKGVI